MHRRDFLRQSLWGAAALVPLSSLPTGAVAAGITGKRYYVDSVHGDDSHAGTSETQAWSGLKRLNQVHFGPGDQIFFKRGGDYPGVFRPQGSGAAGAPVVVDAYGSGPLPHLHADGEAPSTIVLKNIEYWTLRNLSVSNHGATDQAHRTGVHLYHQDFGVAHGIVLQGLNVHDVNGVTAKKAGGGSAILVEVVGKQRPTRYQGLHILNNTIARSQRDGILFLGAGSRDNNNLAKDVIVRGNRVTDVPGDCILVKGCDGALVEHNIVGFSKGFYKNGKTPLPPGDAAAGIWPYDCDNTLIQYNEVGGLNTPNDGEGFDGDFMCHNTVIQYNYSHDNSGGMALICDYGGDKLKIGNHDTIVRYNLSINDALKSGTAALHLNGPVDSAQIYNNIIIIPGQPTHFQVAAFKASNWQGTPKNTDIHDNIVLSTVVPSIDMQRATANKFGANHLYTSSPGTPGIMSRLGIGKDSTFSPRKLTDQQALRRYLTYRPSLEQAVALIKQCFVNGKPVANAEALISKAASAA